MSLLTGLAWRELTTLPHPVIDKSSCLNAVRRSHCTACQDLCPEEIIGADGSVKSWSGCTDCGRCVSACPTRAIGCSERRLERLLALREGEKPLLLRCERLHHGAEWGCLCELSWEALAYLAAYRPLELDLSGCQGCEQTEGRELLGEQLKKLHSVLGAEVFAERVTLHHRPRKEPEEELSRRALFQRTGERSGAGLRTLLRQAPLLGAEELNTDGLTLRRLLSRRMSEKGESLCWEVPAVGEGCTGCGVCMRSCPTKALRVHPEDRSLLLESARCVQCGTCATVCPNRAIRGYESVKLTELGVLRLKTVQKRLCRDCGGALPPNSRSAVCPACMRARMNRAAQSARGKEESD